MLWDVQYQESNKMVLNATGLKASSAIGFVQGLMLNQSASRDVRVTIIPSINQKESGGKKVSL